MSNSSGFKLYNSTFEISIISNNEYIDNSLLDFTASIIL